MLFSMLTVTTPCVLHANAKAESASEKAMPPYVSTNHYTNAARPDRRHVLPRATISTETDPDLRNSESFAVVGLMTNHTTSSLQNVPVIRNTPFPRQLSN